MKSFLIFIVVFFAFETLAQFKVDENQYLSFQNQLLNPGYENGTTKWTVSGSCTTLDAESTSVIEGKRAVSVTPGAGTCSIFQDVAPANIAQITNKNGLISIWVKTANSVVVCLRNDGTRDDAQCSNVVSSSTLEWIKVELPVVFTGSTSFGVEVYKAGSGTEAIILDHAKEGLLPDGYIQQVAQAQKVGSIKIAGCSSSFNSGSTSLSAMGTSSGCTYTTTGDVSAPPTQVAGLVINNRKAGTYKFRATGHFGKTTTTTNSVINFAFRDITNSLNSENINEINHQSGGGAAVAVPVIFGDFEYSSSGNTSYQIYGSTNVTASSTSATIITSLAPLVIDVYYYPPPSEIISGERCDDLRDCETVLSARVAFSGSILSQNTTPAWLSVTRVAAGIYILDYSAANLTQTPSIIISGDSSSSPNATITCAVQNSVISNTSVTIRCAQVAANLDRDFYVSLHKQGADYQNSKVTRILATLEGFVKSRGTARPDLCSAKISATGVISDQVGGCFASCTNATSPVCTFTTGYWKSGTIPNCWGVSSEPAGELTGRTETTTSSTFTNILNGSILAVAGERHYICHGQAP